MLAAMKVSTSKSILSGVGAQKLFNAKKVWIFYHPDMIANHTTMKPPKKFDSILHSSNRKTAAPDGTVSKSDLYICGEFFNFFIEWLNSWPPIEKFTDTSVIYLCFYLVTVGFNVHGCSSDKDQTQVKSGLSFLKFHSPLTDSIREKNANSTLSAVKTTDSVAHNHSPSRSLWVPRSNAIRCFPAFSH